MYCICLGHSVQEKFELQPNGVPMLTTTAPKRHSMLSSKSSVSSITLEDAGEAPAFAAFVCYIENKSPNSAMH